MGCSRDDNVLKQAFVSLGWEMRASHDLRNDVLVVQPSKVHIPVRINRDNLQKEWPSAFDSFMDKSKRLLRHKIRGVLTLVIDRLSRVADKSGIVELVGTRVEEEFLPSNVNYTHRFTNMKNTYTSIPSIGEGVIVVVGSMSLLQLGDIICVPPCLLEPMREVIVIDSSGSDFRVQESQ